MEHVELTMSVAISPQEHGGHTHAGSEPEVTRKRAWGKNLDFHLSLGFLFFPEAFHLFATAIAVTDHHASLTTSFLLVLFKRPSIRFM